MPSAQLTRARKHLSDAQLIAFFREAAWEDGTHAPGNLCDDLDKGRTLDAIFERYDPDREGGSLAIELEVKKVGPKKFRITFGFHGAHEGDGGVWNVTYDAKGELTMCEADGFWFC
ncbi:MAG: hypothetical protein IPI81_06975 [Flavobacteriales bacterium]|nr:hypothetical protein [Flavobacteriales bacterium]MCC6939876.1 hypothetical protein [Flavobacteriales bacterium]